MRKVYCKTKQLMFQFGAFINFIANANGIILALIRRQKEILVKLTHQQESCALPSDSHNHFL
jgi:hypothetical protein